MEENFCPVENKYDRLAIIYIINLMSDELDKIESDNLDNLINDLNLTKTECEDFMSKNDVKSLTQYSSKFNNFTKDYLVTAINEVLFNNLPKSIEDNEFVNDFLVDNACFTNGEFKRRSKKISLIVNHFESQSDSNEVKLDSNEINESNPIAKFLKIVTLILFTSFIGVMFKECYNGKKLFENNTSSNYVDFPTDSALAIVDSAVVDSMATVVDSIPASNNALTEYDSSFNRYDNSGINVESKKYIIAKILVSKPVLEEGYRDVILTFVESERYSDIKEIDDFDSESKYRIRDKVKKEFYSNWDYNDVTNCRIIQAKYHENTYVDCEKARTTLLDIQILDFDSYEEASRFKNGNL